MKQEAPTSNEVKWWVVHNTYEKSDRVASWMVHLRIADLLLERFQHIKNTEFVVGNIAPDSGVPNEDWTYYTPLKEVSHFWDEKKQIQIEQYIKKYFSKEMQKKYNLKQFSFYLGYLTHLMTDIFWSKQILKPCIKSHEKEVLKDRQGFIWKMKADWYDLDFLYLSKNPDFRAFQIYKNAADFQNVYMNIFTEDAFDNRRNYIVGFYSEKRENLEREYPFLNEKQMDQFVTETTDTVEKWTKELFGDEIVD